MVVVEVVVDPRPGRGVVVVATVPRGTLVVDTSKVVVSAFVVGSAGWHAVTITRAIVMALRNTREYDLK